MKKIIPNEKQKSELLLSKEKAIVESFAKTFNKIKRLDESEVKESDVNEIFGWSGKEKQEKLNAKNVQFDQAANAYLETIKNSPKFVEIAKQQIAKNKEAVVQQALSRDKEMGAKKDGKFIFKTNTKTTPPQVIIQYEVGNYIPATGMGGNTPINEE